MDERFLRALGGRLKGLERLAVRLRVGEVTDDDPLNVALGGSATPYTGLKAIGREKLVVGDTVAVLVAGASAVVLGRMFTGAQQERVRFVHGTVAANGTISNAGSGDWSVAKTATGKYTITFNPAFAAAPRVVWSAWTDGGSAGGKVNTDHNTARAANKAYAAGTDNPGTAFRDTKFDFIAVGVRA